jgi:hypothetical protein
MRALSRVASETSYGRGKLNVKKRAAHFLRHAYNRLRTPLLVVVRIASNAPPHIACACCSQLSEPAGHWTSVVGRPSGEKRGGALLHAASAPVIASAAASDAPRTQCAGRAANV